MGLQFQRTETVPAAVRRVIGERIRSAMASLEGCSTSRHTGIHETRKRFKEIRALLRLIRGELGKEFRRENRWYRDAARSLAGARDAQAAVESWHKLMPCLPAPMAGTTAIRNVEPHLCRRRDAMIGTSPDTTATEAALLEALAEKHRELEKLPLRRPGFEALEVGLRRTYRDGRRGMAAAEANPTDEAFHEWRKRIKDLWYHTQALRGVWSKAMGVRIKALKSLSDHVGDDHDLAMLRQLFVTEPGLFGSRGESEWLAAAAWNRQQSLRREALRLGALLYAEHPGAYARRMHSYWSIWRGQRSGSY